MVRIALAAWGSFAGALVALLYDITRIAAPSVTLSAQAYQQHADNDRFWSQRRWTVIRSADPKADSPAPPPDEELTREREASLAVELAAERHAGLQGVIYALIVALVDACVFLPHWRLAKFARANGVA